MGNVIGILKLEFVSFSLRKPINEFQKVKIAKQTQIGCEAPIGEVVVKKATYFKD